MFKRLLPFLPMLVFVACTTDIPSPDIQTAVVASLTAKVWTPTPIIPTATPEPNTGRIVDILNGAMLGADPLAETIVAKFSVIDAKFTNSPPLYLIDILSIHVECESNYNLSCAPEEAFLALMHAFTATDKIIGKVSEQVPSTVLIVQVVTYNRMVQSGMILVNWKDVVDYAKGNINGCQLGSRITRLPPP
jgi:hypothetical protein